MPLDLSASFFYASLGMSAAAVVLFLWLMREPREAGPAAPPRPPLPPDGEGKAPPPRE